MNIKNIFLISLFSLSSILTYSIQAAPMSGATNPVELNSKPSKKKKTSKFKKWNEARKLVKDLFSKEFIIDDLENIHLLEGCETIRFFNGEVRKVEILSMNDLYVSFMPCGGDEADEERISLDEVSSIYDSSEDLIFKGSGGSIRDSKILTFSIVSLVSAFLGLLIPFGVIFGPVAIIFGSLALRKIKISADKNTGRGLALAGLISGIVVTALSLLLIIIILATWW